MSGKVRGRHLMQPLIDDRAWRLVAADRAPAIELDVPEVRGRQAWLLEEFTTPALQGIKAHQKWGKPRTRPSTPSIERERERKRSYMAGRTARRRAWFKTVKTNMGCASCGFREDPQRLQFHHRDPRSKSFEIGNGGIHKSRLDLFRELEKCVLLCRVCHEAVHNDEIAVDALQRFDPWAQEPFPS